VPVSGPSRIAPKLSDQPHLSDAFRLVIEQVSKELGKVVAVQLTLIIVIGKYQNSCRIYRLPITRNGKFDG